MNLNFADLNFAQAGLLVLGIFGLWIVIGAIFNVFAFLSGKKAIQYDPEKEEQSRMEEELPLFARVMKSISGGLRRNKAVETSEDLHLRLQKAGFPFYSPAHYYSRQLANGLLFAAFGLVMGVGYSLTGSDLNPLAIMGIMVGLGIFGATRPAAEVKTGLETRKNDLIMDMTASMASLIVQIKAKNAPIQAMTAIVDSLRVGDHRNLKERMLAAEKLKNRREQVAVQLGYTLEGFGGNLFADLLNRLAIMLAENKQVEAAIREVRDYYPYSLEMDQFLEIFSGGIRGELPMVDRLLEFSKQLKSSRSQQRKEQGAKAQMLVSVANVFLLLPTVVLFIAPLLTQLGSFFGN